MGIKKADTSFGQDMKTATTTFKNFLASNKQFVCAEVFDIALTNGVTIYVTTADIPITYNYITYSSTGIQVSGLLYKLNIGLDVDEQTITISASRTMLVNGVPVLDALRSGMFDLARITRTRVYLPDWVSAPVGGILLFTGYVSTIDSLGRTSADLKVKSDLSLLDVQMPRRSYQAGCINVLYDAQCAANRASFTTAGATLSGSTIGLINWASATLSYYDLGTITFTSGANNGLTRTIKQSTGSSLLLSYPLPNTPSIGDTFDATAGCDKTITTCTNRFSNQVNFMGFPFIPASSTAF